MYHRQTFWPSLKSQLIYSGCSEPKSRRVSKYNTVHYITDRDNHHQHILQYHLFSGLNLIIEGHILLLYALLIIGGAVLSP
jgi:hypothetical protein